jgi:hypothetical protein
MLSAVLLAYDSPQSGPRRRDAIARSLSSLVDACVRGVVADAVLAGPPDEALAALADEAGCALVEAATAAEGLRQALALVRRPHVLLLRAGYAVERGFCEEIEDVFTYGGGAEQALVLRAAPASLLTRLAPSLAEPVGLVAPKRAVAAAGATNLRALARRLGAAGLTAQARRTA